MASADTVAKNLLCGETPGLYHPIEDNVEVIQQRTVREPVFSRVEIRNIVSRGSPQDKMGVQ
eukprot:8225457-Alexandrium_andersonii.AAC.1